MSPQNTWTIGSSAGRQRLDQNVLEHIGGLSRSAAQRLIREGLVAVNGIPSTKPGIEVTSGDRIAVALPSALEAGSPGVELAGEFDVVYEDAHLLVVNKPPGLPVHSGAGHPSGNLVNVLLTSRPEIASVGQPDRPGIVHRLDKDTSGLLIVAKSAEAYEALARMIKAREIKRRYTALVAGNVAPDSGVIDAPIGRDPSNRTRQAVVRGGKTARTKYSVRKQYNGFALLALALETGRMHQIRVHLAAAGYPVAGDPVYGGSGTAVPGLSRQFLHASSLEFNHPVTGKPLTFTSPLPEDLRAALRIVESR